MTQGFAASATRPWELYSGRQRVVFLLLLFLIGTSSYADRNVIGVLLEPIKAEFGVSDTMLGLLSGFSFAIFYAVLGLPIASWADRGDRRFIITAALSVWSLMTALCGAAQSFWQLALARIGVGVGEAGAIPPAQSLIADYFAPERRGRALGIFMMCAFAGAIVGLVLGGWVAQHYGWRAAFVVLGLPGLLLAILARWVLREPRHLPQFAIRTSALEQPLAAWRALLSKPAYRDVLIALVLYFLVAYGALGFTVPFMIRVHGLNVAEAGAWFGAITAVASIVGNIVGGFLSDRLAAKDVAWLGRLPGWTLIAAVLFYELAFFAADRSAMAAGLLAGGVLITAAVPPIFAGLHHVCGSKRRAMAVAVVFFFANLIGLGCGPLIAGVLSDAFAASHGAGEGLRYAMMIVMLTFIPCGWFLLRAGRRMAADAET